MTRIYLATPYSHEDPAVRALRFEAINITAAKLMLEGYAVFSPISQSHPIAEYLPTETGNWDFWQKEDLPFLEVCDWLYVLPIDGWQESVGVRGEIEFAEALGIPIKYLDPRDYLGQS